jgi:hypothetical protein
MTSVVEPQCFSAVSVCFDFDMSVPGQSRHFGLRPTTSGLPLETDIVRAGRHVSKVPKADVATFMCGITIKDFASVDWSLESIWS